MAPWRSPAGICDRTELRNSSVMCVNISQPALSRIVTMLVSIIKAVLEEFGPR
jgi:hypothetical protein